MDWISVGGFLVMAFGMAWACFIGLHALGLPFIVSGNAGMLCPAIAALVQRLVRREPLTGLGLSTLGPFRWYATAYMIVPAVIVSGACLELLTGYQHWHPHMPAIPGAAPQLLLVLGVVGAFTTNAIPSAAFALGEELGWRGHLLPRLSPLGGPVAAVLVGAVWGLWHTPVIALDGLGALLGRAGTGPKGWELAPFFWLTTVPLGVIYAWLRYRSGSVWPCALAHGMANSGLATLAIYALSTPGTPLLGGPIGVIGVVPLWAVAIWLVATGRLRAPDWAC